VHQADIVPILFEALVFVGHSLKHSDDLEECERLVRQFIAVNLEKPLLVKPTNHHAGA